MTTMMQPNLMPKRGDVVLVLFPHTGLRTAKTRPALVVQPDNLNTDLSQIIVAMITSRTFWANHSSRVLVEINSKEGKSSGLLADSVVMTDNLVTISTMAIDRVIGNMPMQKINKALRHTLGL